MAPTPGNRALLDKLNGVNATLGLAPMAPLDPLKRGAGDVSFVAADVDSLVGLGPASEGDHTSAETVDVPSLWRQAKRAALFAVRPPEPEQPVVTMPRYNTMTAVLLAALAEQSREDKASSL
jgi:glutamate carboxypeptidase